MPTRSQIFTTKRGMTTLVNAALTVRRGARWGAGFLATAAFAVLVLLGVFSQELSALRVSHTLVIGAWVAVLSFRASRRHALVKSRSGAPIAMDLELGLLLLVGAHAAVQVGGGLSGELYPLVYVLIAFLASFARGFAGPALIAAAVGLEAAIYFVTEEQSEPRPLLLHAAFIIFFGLLNLLFTRAEIARVRERGKQALDLEKEKVKDDTRLFRLVAAPSSSARTDDERLLRASVEEVHHQLYHVLSLVQRSLDLHTCVLMMREDDGDALQIVELATDSDDIADGPFGLSGAVGAIAQRGVAMNLKNLKPGYGGLCFYRSPARVSAFLGIPITKDGEVTGVLCADRIGDRPFTARDEQVLELVRGQVARALENERVFVQLEKSKREQSILHQASKSLGSALDEAAVIDAGLMAAAEIAPYDFAAITFYDAETRKHHVKRAVGTSAQKVDGLIFRDNTSLTAMAVKNRHYLPYRGDFDPAQQTVFTKRTNLKSMRSVLVLPLIVREDAIGTLALAAERGGVFTESARATLSVLVNQLAVSLANAAAVKRLEEMATTDGLTGCLNKRQFLIELDQKLRSAERFGRKLSLIVTDIDHFKSVNDTYGHATGDVVIKELGAILTRMKRETDIVARFGGEEFCILCEETDTEGAVLLAERVREEVKGTIFQSELGELSVTASLGVATFPDHASASTVLFEESDKALYAAKHGGRDQVCAA